MLHIQEIVMCYFQFLIQSGWKGWWGDFQRTHHTSGWPRARKRARISLSINTDSLRVATWKLQSKTRAKPSTAWRTLQWRPRSDCILWLEPLGMSCHARKHPKFSKITREGTQLSPHSWLRNVKINSNSFETVCELLFMKYPNSLFAFQINRCFVMTPAICYLWWEMTVKGCSWWRNEYCFWPHHLGLCNQSSLICFHWSFFFFFFYGRKIQLSWIFKDFYMYWGYCYMCTGNIEPRASYMLGKCSTPCDSSSPKLVFFRREFRFS